MNRSLQYGEGLFETIKWLGLTKKLRLHYERLKNSAEVLGMPCPPYGKFVELIQKATKEKKGIYVKFLLLCGGSDYFPEKCTDVSTKIIIRDLPRKPDSVKLCISPYRIHSGNPLRYHKTLNYLFNILVKREALRRNFFDGIILNESGLPTETSSANLLLYRRGKFFTPARELGLLRGTTLTLLSEEIDIRETYLTTEQLKEGYLFIVNSLLGLVPVESIEKEELKIDRKLVEELNELLVKLENLPADTCGDVHEGK